MSIYIESSMLRNLAFEDPLTRIGNNDQFGHDVGDQILKTFVNVVDRTLAETECSFGRWGGEEFVIVIPRLAASEAAKLAEHVKETIAKYTFPHIGTVTASFGVF